MSLSKRTLLRAMTGAGALIATGTPVFAQTATKLRLAHSGQEAETQHAAAVEFARIVKEKSNGQLNIQVYASSALGNDNTAVTGTRGGTIDFVLSGNPYFTGIVPRMNVLDLPFIFDNAAHAYKVLDGTIGRGLLDEMGAHGMKGLSFLEVGFRNLTNSKRVVKTPDDVKGLKVRTTPNPAHIKAFQLLGANPTPMPIVEVYTAMESKAIDGQENPATIIRNAKFYEVQKFMSMTRHAYTAEPLVMNKAKFDGMTPALQQVLLDAAKAAAVFHRELNRKGEAADIAYLRTNGMQVEETIDAEPFRKIVAGPVKALFAEKNGMQLVEAVEKAR